ncbi:MAG: hypothetical protein RLZZ172_732 [Bacteroidota bacterium]
MEYCDGHKCGYIKPDGNIEVSFASLQDGHEHVQSEYHPDNGDGDIDGPFQFGVFLAGRHTQWDRDGCCHDDQLPAPEVNLAEEVTRHACFQKTLQGVIIAKEDAVAYEGKDDGIGVQWPEPAEAESDRFLACRNAAQVPFREYHEQGYPDAYEHAYDAPDNGGIGKISDDLVVVRELFNVHVKGFGCWGLNWIFRCRTTS